MNRYKYSDKYLRPAALYPIKRRQIWRGIKCSTNPMLIQIIDGDKNNNGWHVREYKANEPGFYIDQNQLLETYALDTDNEQI